MAWRGTPMVLIAGALVLAGTGAAQLSAEGEAGEVIFRQLAAFRAGNYKAAYAFASRAIQAQFDLPAFEQMVKSGYPQIAHSTDAWLRTVEPGPDGALHVLVRIRGADGVFVLAVYAMVHEESGWRINGVVARPDPSTL